MDNHAFWPDPANPDHYLDGCDGGVYETWDRAAHWQFKANLPVSQFYDVTADNSQPFYYVYGGMQDNNSYGVPSRTRNVNGIMNSDWFVTWGGDGFRTVVDPEDPDTVYSELQYGTLVRYDRRTGERTGISPMEPKGAEPYRWNWDSPLIISPHAHTRLYFGANQLFRSDDRGDTWRAISPDLTRQIDRNKLPVMGKVWSADAVAKNASTSFYGNTVALAESPQKEGLIYIGTDDGLIQVTEDGGQHWTKYEKFPGVPDNTYVSRLAASRYDANTVYAAFDNHKNGDFKPYLLKSTDAGKSWASIASNLPENGPVLAFVEDPVNPKLLFAGTEFGLWFTIDGGGKWIQLKGSFPTISVHDIVIQAREGDLVVGTFGRGIYILDDLRPLRVLKPEALDGQAVLYPVKKALLYVQAQPLGGRGKASQGSAFYIAENPPFGAVFTYYLKDKLKTLKEKRQEAEKEAAKKNATAPYPTPDQLRAEAQEPAPAVFLTVADASGKPVRRISATNAQGMNRVAWDLHYPAPQLPKEGEKIGAGRRLVSLAGRPAGDAGRIPGDARDPHQRRVHAGGRAGEVCRRAAGRAQHAAGGPRRAHRLPGEGGPSLPRRGRGAEHRRRPEGASRARSRRLCSRPRPPTISLARLPSNSSSGTSTILRRLRGDTVLRDRNENTPPSIDDRVETIMQNERMSSSPPPRTDLDGYAIASEEFTEELGKLRAILEQDLPKLEKAMEQAGAPWTPGRIPEWNERSAKGNCHPEPPEPGASEVRAWKGFLRAKPCWPRSGILHRRTRERSVINRSIAGATAQAIAGQEIQRFASSG